MVEKRTYVEIVLVVGLMISLGINITNEDVVDNIYTCVDKNLDMYCFDVRDYGDKIDYRCLYDETNKRKYESCNSGWEKITLQEVLNNKYQIDSNQWLCSPQRCEAI